MIKPEQLQEFTELVKNPMWLAGFFDGEGCVSLSFYNTRNNYQLEVRIAQKDCTVLHLIQIFYGGKVVASGVYNHQLRWNGMSAKTFLETIKPYSIIKRNQIEAALQYIDTLVYRLGSNLSSDVMSKRSNLFQLLKSEKVG